MQLQQTINPKRAGHRQTAERRSLILVLLAMLAMAIGSIGLPATASASSEREPDRSSSAPDDDTQVERPVVTDPPREPTQPGTAPTTTSPTPDTDPTPPTPAPTTTTPASDTDPTAPTPAPAEPTPAIPGATGEPTPAIPGATAEPTPSIPGATAEPTPAIPGATSEPTPSAPPSTVPPPRSTAGPGSVTHHSGSNDAGTEIVPAEFRFVGTADTTLHWMGFARPVPVDDADMVCEYIENETKVICLELDIACIGSSGECAGDGQRSTGAGLGIDSGGLKDPAKCAFEVPSPLGGTVCFPNPDWIQGCIDGTLDDSTDCPPPPTGEEAAPRPTGTGADVDGTGPQKGSGGADAGMSCGMDFDCAEDFLDWCKAMGGQPVTELHEGFEMNCDLEPDSLVELSIGASNAQSDAGMSCQTLSCVAEFLQWCWDQGGAPSNGVEGGGWTMDCLFEGGSSSAQQAGLSIQNAPGEQRTCVTVTVLGVTLTLCTEDVPTPPSSGGGGTGLILPAVQR